MQTIVKAADDAALLAMIPHLIGMQPHNSVVLLGFVGNRTHGGMRFDLPVPTSASPALVYKRVSKALVGMLAKLPGADGVVIAVVTDERFGQSAVPPELEFVAELTRCIDRSRFALKGVLCQAGDGWAPYFDSKVPVGGFPLTDLASADISSQLPPDRPAIFDAETTPLRVADADPALKKRVMRRFRSARDQIADVDSKPSPAILLPHPVECVEKALESNAKEFAMIAGTILALAQYSVMSYIMMLQWANDVATGSRLVNELMNFDPARGWEGSEMLDLLQGQGPPPDFERLDRAITFLVSLVACADDALRPGLLVMLAWMHWASGRGSMASVYLAEAAQIDPANTRVYSIDSMVRNGVMPAWLFAESDHEDEDEDEDEDDEDDDEDGWGDYLKDWDEDDDEDDDRDDWENRPHNPF